MFNSPHLAAMVLGTLSWFIAKPIPSFAYVIVASSALMGISMGLQILPNIYQVWFIVIAGVQALLALAGGACTPNAEDFP